MDARIDEDLKRKTDNTDDSRCQTDPRRREAQSATEEEAVAGAFRSARSGQEGKGHRVEGAGVEGEEEVDQQREEDVSGPGLAEGRAFVLGSDLGNWV